ncbi:alkaline phosphatase D family protein [uncultured Neptuniibacter sp.]|uniref:alkaline phosphatase D family protein n=1 Tax=unclassified Neptuniibacter TaxID=2630693 RepID=UPI0032B2E808|tara:strand:- start:4624 stop:6504 length:1881 start_codon:yes stop_codon:yes gene_type:complete
MMNNTVTDLPYIIAGPMIRRLLPEQMVLWLVTREPLNASLTVHYMEDQVISIPCDEITQTVAVGESAYINLITFNAETPLPENSWLSYDLHCVVEGEERNLRSLLPNLMYEGELRPHFVLKTQLNDLLHGSCRKPHYPSKDALLRVDEVLDNSKNSIEQRPALLMMSGDQIYADDVAGPMLSAVHQTITLLGLRSESIPGATVGNCGELYQSKHCYYEREELLPHTEANQDLRDKFFGGAKKPIFTADTAHNHLITLSEVLAMYFLVWSPQLWDLIKLDVSGLSDKHLDRFLTEQKEIKQFSQGLGQVQRALAHIPVYMIFDDHDVTDDWNLTRGWEEAAYGHPFSRRIIGNALIGYWLCQAWGNAPERFPVEWVDTLDTERDELVTQMLEFESWHYSLPTSPKLVVLDTRTKRWWSENSLSQPSGLMDWEALSELQQELIGEQSVLLISPAPIFGMKLIETVQRIFTFFGKALTVDAENWMAHSGSANVILNIFRHPKTPQNFVILSGDVHYSFTYDIKIRFRENSPDIWQVTCSGLKNEFPHKLLQLFDRLNRWLYGSRSPLNWFTKRRRMQVRSRIPEGQPHNRVHNRSGVGRLLLNDVGEPEKISVLTVDDREVVFPERRRL